MKPEQIDLFNDKQVILHKVKVRGEISPIWNVIIHTPSSTGRIRMSLKTTSLDEAKARAREEFFKAEARVQSGLPLQAARFDKTAREYLAWLTNEFERKRTTANRLETHTAITRNLFIPFFGDTFLHQIGTKEIEKFQDQRTRIGTTHIGKSVKGSTHNRDASILNAIFKFAMREKYINEIPMMPKHHHFAQRASFSRGEMKKLQRKLDEWVANVHPHDAPHIRHYRELFRLYVLMISYSGIRPGKEMASLRWDGIEFRRDGKIDYVYLPIISSKNKKGEIITRGVVGMNQLRPHIEHVKNIPDLYNKKLHVFAHPPTTQLSKSFVGKPIQTFKKQWEAFVEWADLKHEEKPPYRRRQLYSLRHYYFEQRMLNGDLTLHMLAKNGGTSIAVIEKWYAEIQATQYAKSLSGVVDRVNS